MVIAGTDCEFLSLSAMHFVGNLYTNSVPKKHYAISVHCGEYIPLIFMSYFSDLPQARKLLYAFNITITEGEPKMYFKLNKLTALLGYAVLVNSAQATMLNTGDTLTIHAGMPVFNADGDPVDVVDGSWFGIDSNGNKVVSGYEKRLLAQGTTGLVIGMTTSPGAYHYEIPTAADTNAITAPWDYFGATGSDYVVIPVTGGTSGLDMSGWRVAWNTIPVLSFDSDAWGIGFSDGVGNFNWSGVYGETYTLDYHSAIPAGDPSGFGGIKYASPRGSC